MDVSQIEEFLLLEHNVENNEHYVSIAKSLSTLLTDWQAANRTSPVFPLNFEGKLTKENDALFKKDSFLIFIGTFNPTLFNYKLIANGKAWLTYGLFNFVVYVESVVKFKKILAWLNSRGERHEIWHIKNHRIVEFSYSTHKLGTESYWRTSLKRIVPTDKYYVIQGCTSEYSVLVVSYLARAELTLPRLISDVLAVNEFAVEVSNNGNESLQAAYEVFGFITELNAGLSRFSSQTFSGFSPIVATESHLWTHSLLGIGLANLAVFRFREFIQNTVGSLRIPDLFSLYKSIDSFPDLAKLSSNNEYWYKNHISDNLLIPDLKIQFQELVKEPIIPLITYFSGRDGFRSHHNSLSVPLESLNACNAPEWSLITMTHEISHIVIRGILPTLYPDLDSTSDLKKAWELTFPNSKPTNLFEMIRKYLFLGIIDVEKCSLDKNYDDFNIKSYIIFKEILEKWHRDVEEIMAHIFDFIYFYSESEKEYVEQIWTSWSVIPNIRIRIRDYVIRTACTLLSKNLRKGAQEEELVREILVKNLSDLVLKNPNAHYIEFALELIKDHWENDLKFEIIARKAIVRIVRTFMYSTDFVSNINYEKWISLNRSSTGKLYDLRQGQITDLPITNPLVFIKEFSNSTRPSMVQSFWLYNTLVFNYDTSK
jgi:hypothetical protein